MGNEKSSPPRRTLKIDIISVFFILFVLSFGLVIWYISDESNHSIHAFAHQEIRRVSQVIEEQSNDFDENTVVSISIGGSLFGNYDNFEVTDPNVRDHLLTVVHYNVDISNFYVTDLEGNDATVYTLDQTTENHFLSDPKKPLPKEARYAFELSINNPEPKRDMIYYYDEKLKVIAKENVKPYYDPRTRDWYKGAMKTKGVYWTPVYKFIPSLEYGITAAQVFYDKQGKPRGVIGADLSFILLSRFIEEQRIGKTGSTFLYDSKNDFLLPQHGDPEIQKSNENLIKKALNLYDKDGGVSHVKGEDGENYLLYTSDTNLFGSTDWKTIVIVPVHHYFSSLFEMQRNILIFVVVMLILATTFVVIFARRISKPITTLSSEINRVRMLELDDEVRVKSHVKEIFEMDEAIFNMRNAVRSFTRYVPKKVVKQLLNQNRDIVLGGENRDLTVLFTDIVGFTTISEKISTEELTKLLEEYFEEITAIILRHEGTIDKYIGDSVMAFWGAPDDVENREQKACRAALECRAFIERLNEKRAQENQPLFWTRFGLHCGKSIVGNVGTHDRMNYTALGDAINTASRLEGINKIYGSTIAISDTLYEKVQSEFLCRPLDTLAVKGREQETTIFELVNHNDFATDKERALCTEFIQALEAHKRGDPAPLQKLKERFPDDGPTSHYLST